MTEDFNTPMPPIEPLPIQEPKKSKKTIWIIVIVVVVVLCCCCIIAGILGYNAFNNGTFDNIIDYSMLPVKTLIPWII